MKNLIINKYLECEKELKININLSVEDVMFIKGKIQAFNECLLLLHQHTLYDSLKDFKIEEYLKKENDYLDKILRLQVKINLYRKQFPDFIIEEKQIDNEIKKLMMEALNNEKLD